MARHSRAPKICLPLDWLLALMKEAGCLFSNLSKAIKTFITRYFSLCTLVVTVLVYKIVRSCLNCSFYDWVNYLTRNWLLVGSHGICVQNSTESSSGFHRIRMTSFWKGPECLCVCLFNILANLVMFSAINNCYILILNFLLCFNLFCRNQLIFLPK